LPVVRLWRFGPGDETPGRKASMACPDIAHVDETVVDGAAV